jgi:hypothetical protein
VDKVCESSTWYCTTDSMSEVIVPLWPIADAIAIAFSHLLLTIF